MYNKVEIVYKIHNTVKFDYELKCDVSNESLVNEELENYEDKYIFENNNSTDLIEEKILEAITIDDGEIDSVKVDYDYCTSDYNYNDNIIEISSLAEVRVNLIMNTSRDDIDDYLGDIDISSCDKSVSFKEISINDYYL